MISNWIYNEQEIKTIEDVKLINDEAWGFVYLLSLYDIETKDLKYQYIGKKNLYSVTSKTATKKEMLIHPKSYFRRKRNKDGNIKYYTVIKKESNWKNYISSNDFIKDNKDKFIIERQIISIATENCDLSYMEVKEIICNGAMENEIFLNGNVSIKRIGKIKNK